jgi:hypothetical protein
MILAEEESLAASDTRLVDDFTRIPCVRKSSVLFYTDYIAVASKGQANPCVVFAVLLARIFLGVDAGGEQRA